MPNAPTIRHVRGGGQPAGGGGVLHDNNADVTP